MTPSDEYNWNYTSSPEERLRDMIDDDEQYGSMVVSIDEGRHQRRASQTEGRRIVAVYGSSMIRPGDYTLGQTRWTQQQR